MRAGLALIAAVTALSAPASVRADITRGPYVQQATTGSAIVVVEVDPAQAIEIHYGDGQVASSPSATHHEVALTGLSADTRYDYAVFAGGQELSASHALWTAVEPGSPFRFVLYGDTRTQPDRHMEVVQAIIAEAPNIVVHTGDLVADGNIASQWDEFFAIETPLLSQVPLYPAVGNHDEYSGDALLFREAFALPETELYYSFDYGSVHFVMIDGEARIESACNIEGQVVLGCLDDAQRAWLESDLAAAAANPMVDHIFVLTHKGPYTSVGGRSGSGQMRALMPLFEQYGVTAVLSGHDHHYERGETDTGMPYMISGGAGAPLYDISEPSPDPHTVLVQSKSHHYVVMDVVGRTVEVTVRTPDGTVLDSVIFTSRQPPDPDPNPDPDPDPDPDPQPDPASGGCAAGGGGVGAGALVAFALALVRRRRRADN